MRPLVIAVSLSLFASSAAAESDQERAKAHFEQAEAYFKTESFALAAAEYEKAHKLSGHAVLLFNVGLAHENAGDARRAIAFYDRYLSAKPRGDRAAEARARRAKLERTASLPARTQVRRPPKRGALVLRFAEGSGAHRVSVRTASGGTFKCERGRHDAPCAFTRVPAGPAELSVERAGLPAATRSLQLTGAGTELQLGVQVSWFWRTRWVFTGVALGGLGLIALSGVDDGAVGTLSLTSGILAFSAGAPLAIAGFVSQPTYVAMQPPQ